MPKISALPAATSVGASDLYAIVQSSTTKKATLTQSLLLGASSYDLSVSNATMTVPMTKIQVVTDAKMDGTSVLTLPDMTQAGVLRVGESLIIYNESGLSISIKLSGATTVGVLDAGMYLVMSLKGLTDPVTGDWDFYAGFTAPANVFGLISALTPVTALDGTEVLPVVQSGFARQATVNQVVMNGATSYDLSVSNADITVPMTFYQEVFDSKSDGTSKLTLPDMTTAGVIRVGGSILIYNSSPYLISVWLFGSGAPMVGISPGQFAYLTLAGLSSPTTGNWSFYTVWYSPEQVFTQLIASGYPGGYVAYDLSVTTTQFINTPIPAANQVSDSAGSGSILQFVDITTDPMLVGESIYVVNTSANIINVQSFSGSAFDLRLPPGYQLDFTLTDKSTADGTWVTKYFPPMQTPIPHGVESGAADAYVVTTDLGLTWESGKSIINVTFTHANTGASTVNVDGGGVVNLTAGGNVALVANQIVANYPGLIMKVGSHWELLNPAKV